MYSTGCVSMSVCFSKHVSVRVSRETKSYKTPKKVCFIVSESLCPTILASVESSGILRQMLLSLKG